MTPRTLALLAAVAALAFFAGFQWREPVVSVPRIVTVYDTVYETLTVVPPRVVTTDTVNLILRETVYETTFVRIGCTPEERTNIWPVLGVEVGKRVGDTTIVSTFSLRTGEGAVTRVWTPGPLVGVWPDSTPSPRLEFGPPPRPHRLSLWDKIKWGGIGYGACRLTTLPTP